MFPIPYTVAVYQIIPRNFPLKVQHIPSNGLIIKFATSQSVNVSAHFSSRAPTVVLATYAPPPPTSLLLLHTYTSGLILPSSALPKTPARLPPIFRAPGTAGEQAPRRPNRRRRRRHLLESISGGSEDNTNAAAAVGEKGGTDATPFHTSRVSQNKTRNNLKHG